jgi:V8-like Glu-specific endopeptidase
MAERPIPWEDHEARVEERPKLTDEPAERVSYSHYVAGDSPELVVTDTTLVAENDDGTPTYRIDYTIAGTKVGVRRFAPPPESIQLERERELLTEDAMPDAVMGFLPDHLDLTVRPQALDPRFHRERRLEHETKAGERYATALFPPENRYVFSDTAFPWSTCGKVLPSRASGVMVGPRHLLTVSHGIDWHTPTEREPWVAQWLSFTPSYFDRDDPFGTAGSTHIYWQEQVTGPTIDGTEAQFDYVVVVLDRRIGDITGWMGSRSYTDDWDGETYWSHIGYPTDLVSGERPAFIGDVSLDGTEDDDAHQAMHHRGDVWPGQSGGPYFGWWEGEPWPRVVSVQSWEQYEDAAQTIPLVNGASGGSSMVDLIIRARNDFP